MTANYEIIKDEEKLREFIAWLPELLPNEVFYLACFARKKYCSDVKYIKSDKWQIARKTSKKKDLFNKIKQLECPIGSYVIKDIEIPQEALSLYISVNPRDMLRATRQGLIKFAHLITQEYNGYNPHQEIMSEIHRACTRKVWYSFDFDGTNFNNTMAEIDKIINLSCIKVIKTHSGFHVLVKLKEIHKDFSKLWYQNFSKLPGIDVRGDILEPVVGCTQGNFVPYFMEI